MTDFRIVAFQCKCGRYHAVLDLRRGTIAWLNFDWVYAHYCATCGQRLADTYICWWDTFWQYVRQAQRRYRRAGHVRFMGKPGPEGMETVEEWCNRETAEFYRKQQEERERDHARRILAEVERWQAEHAD